MLVRASKPSNASPTTTASIIGSALGKTVTPPVTVPVRKQAVAMVVPAPEVPSKSINVPVASAVAEAVKQVTSESQATIPPKASSKVDYNALPPLYGPPRVGDVIAFKVCINGAIMSRERVHL